MIEKQVLRVDKSLQSMTEGAKTWHRHMMIMNQLDEIKQLNDAMLDSVNL